MVYDKHKYQDLINKSKLFSLDKETESIAFRRESYKMVEYLYCYLLAINEEAYEPYGCEIMNIATRCINNFDSSKGVFLHYFSAAWKQEYSHICSDVIIDNKLKGIKITEEERRCIVKYYKYIEKSSQSSSREEQINLLSEALGISCEKVAEFVFLNNTSVVSNITLDDEGNEVDIFEQICYQQSDDGIDARDTIKHYLQKIETSFVSLQVRQKAIIADMLTIKIWPIMMEHNFTQEEFTFVSEYVINEYNKYGVMPSQRQIASKHNRDEASISRSIKQFLHKL